MNDFIRYAKELLRRPWRRPRNPKFSSGPCAKPPGYNLRLLKHILLGRSHRSKPSKEAIRDLLEKTRKILGLPADYKICIMPASDTGAFEAALWNMIGERPADVCAWEAFGRKWLRNVREKLRVPGVDCCEPRYGFLPDLSLINFDHDVVITENGTTSGVMIPRDLRFPLDRAGLTFSDATSAVFAIPMQPWDRYDVVTYSWQKGMGGEAGFGMLILSLRAIERLNAYTPENRPIPVIFELKKDGRFNEEISEGNTINTISMLCVEDARASLNWMIKETEKLRRKGFISDKATVLDVMHQRTQKNFRSLSAWVERTPWIDFLVSDPAIRSPSSVCLKLNEDYFPEWGEEEKAAFCKKLVGIVEAHKAGYDFNAYKIAPAGLRIWCGPTIEAKDVERLTKWIDWAFVRCCREMGVSYRPEAIGGSRTSNPEPRV